MSECVVTAVRLAARKIFSTCHSIPFLVENAAHARQENAAAVLSVYCDDGQIARECYFHPEIEYPHVLPSPATVWNRGDSRVEAFSMVVEKNDWWVFCEKFLVYTKAFYVQFHVPAISENDRILKHECIAITESFAYQCRTLFETFFQQILEFLHTVPGNSPDSITRTMGIHSQAVTFSERCEQAALIDADGFVVASIGDAERAEQSAGEIGLFRQRVLFESEGLTDGVLECLHISDASRSVCIGNSPDSDMAIVLEASGLHAAVHVSFIFQTVCDFLRNKEWMSQSTFTSAGQPRQKYIATEGSTVFHVPACRRVAGRHVRGEIREFHRRAHALQAELKPCTVCNP